MSSTPPSVIAGIEYAVCEPGDTPEVGRLLAESFTRHDPPAVAVGLTRGEFEAFVKTVRNGCRAQKVDYVKIRTDEPLDVALSSYLADRAIRIGATYPATCETPAVFRIPHQLPK